MLLLKISLTLTLVLTGKKLIVHHVQVTITVTTVPSYPHVQGEMLTLCGTEVGTVHEITTLVPNLLEDGQYSVQSVMNVGEGGVSDVLLVKNGTNTDQSVTWTLNGTSNGGFY